MRDENEAEYEYLNNLESLTPEQKTRYVDLINKTWDFGATAIELSDKHSIEELVEALNRSLIIAESARSRSDRFRTALLDASHKYENNYETGCILKEHRVDRIEYGLKPDTAYIYCDCGAREYVGTWYTSPPKGWCVAGWHKIIDGISKYVDGFEECVYYISQLDNIGEKIS